jgi:hypothetical protein
VWFPESMDRINRAIQGTSDPERIMGDVLDVVLAIFGCDRTLLLYPCDPEADSLPVLSPTGLDAAGGAAVSCDLSLALARQSAEAMVPPALPELQAQLSRVADGLAGALEELQEIARGIHPAILAQGGLTPALKTRARRPAAPVELELRAGTRLPEPVEVAAYDVVSEALTNAAKHARFGGTRHRRSA